MREDKVAYVEVGEDDQQSPVLRSKHVLCRNDNVVEGDVSCAGGGRVGCLDLLRLDTLAPGHQEGSETALSLKFSNDIRMRGLESLWLRQSGD